MKREKRQAAIAAAQNRDQANAAARGALREAAERIIELRHSEAMLADALFDLRSFDSVSGRLIHSQGVRAEARREVLEILEDHVANAAVRIGRQTPDLSLLLHGETDAEGSQ